MDVHIRQMTREDWPAVSRIYQEGLLTGQSTFQTECPSYESWNAAHLTDGRLIITAEGNIAGWCALSATSSRPAYRGVVEVSLYIDEACRYQGLGRRLLDYLCASSEREGYWCLYAAIFAVNRGSIALVKACGFREIGHRERIAKDRFGQWQDTVLFEKRSTLI